MVRGVLAPALAMMALGWTGEVQGDNSCGLRAHSSQAHQVSAHVCKGPSEHMLIRSAPGVARSTPGAGGPH